MGVTYIQALELMGLVAPKTPRQRNMLNVFARLPAADPLRSTMMIVDINQPMRYGGLIRSDGTATPIGGNVFPWSMQAGRLLDVSEMAKMMGFDLSEEVDLRSTTRNQMRLMLGTSTHVATAGFALIGLLAAAGSC